MFPTAKNFLPAIEEFFFFFFISVKRSELDLEFPSTREGGVFGKGNDFVASLATGNPFLFTGGARDCVCLQPSGNLALLLRFENERSVRTGGSKGFDTVERLITIFQILDATRSRKTRVVASSSSS